MTTSQIACVIDVVCPINSVGSKMVEEKESGSPGRAADSEEDKNNPLPGQLYSFSRHHCQTHLPSVSLSFICLRLESRLSEALQPPF